MGCDLTTLFGNTAIGLETRAIEEPKKKHSMLPVLVVLFLLSYGLMTMLIVEQGETIQAQRTLIQQLFTDSQELSAMKMKALREKRAAQRPQAPVTQAPVTQAPSVQTPSNQVPSAKAQSHVAPSTQAQSSQAPSTQVSPQKRAQGKAGKTPKVEVPSPPASDLADERRSLKTI